MHRKNNTPQYYYNTEFFRQLGTRRLKMALYVNNIHRPTLEKLIDPILRNLPDDEKKLVVIRFQMEKEFFDSEIRPKELFRNVPEYSEDILSGIMAKLSKRFLEKLDGRKRLRTSKKKKSLTKDTSVESIGFSERTRLKLKVSKILYLDELLTATDAEMLGAYSFGKACLEEVNLFKKLYKF